MIAFFFAKNKGGMFTSAANSREGSCGKGFEMLSFMLLDLILNFKEKFAYAKNFLFSELLGILGLFILILFLLLFIFYITVIV